MHGSFDVGKEFLFNNRQRTPEKQTNAKLFEAEGSKDISLSKLVGTQLLSVYAPCTNLYSHVLYIQIQVSLCIHGPL